MTVKLSIGKLTIEGGLEDLMGFIENNDIEILPIRPLHLKTLLQLPYHHKDPFDRLIISQAQTEALIILGLDEFFNAYEVPVLWG